MHKLIIVDDEINILNALKRSIRVAGWHIDTFDNPEVALRAVASTDVDVVISDYRMPRMSGAVFLTEVMNLKPDTMRIILSGQADLEGMITAINDAQIFRFVAKPWCADELKLVIRQALYFRELKLENKRLRATVRQHEREHEKQLRVLRRLESQHPGITHVERDQEGAVVLTD